MKAMQYIHITEWDNHHVSVFSLEGKILASYGMTMCGNKPGQFTYPRGIRVDRSDMIYVTDNNRVQIF